MGSDIASPLAAELFLRSFGGCFLNRHCVLHHFLHGVALVSIKLLLNSCLSQLTRVGRELRMTGFTGAERWDVADSFEYPKSALCHISVSHSFINCATIES
jgi:hypothetical protein